MWDGVARQANPLTKSLLASLRMERLDAPPAGPLTAVVACPQHVMGAAQARRTAISDLFARVVGRPVEVRLIALDPIDAGARSNPTVASDPSLAATHPRAPAPSADAPALTPDSHLRAPAAPIEESHLFRLATEIFSRPIDESPRPAPR